MRGRFWSAQELEACSEALLGPRGERLIAWLDEVSTGRRSAEMPGKEQEIAAGLGWIDGAVISRRGHVAADALREYALWQAREGRLHDPDASDTLRRMYCMEGERVLEVGCGSGCNLLSLQDDAASVMGVDLEPTYLQLHTVLAQWARRPQAGLACAAAESLPFAGGSFDAVLCSSVLQYVDPARALSEIARVLRPGGRLVLMVATLSGILKAHGSDPQLLRRPARLRWLARILLDSLALQLLGRRVLSSDDTTTASPAHPTGRHHQRLLSAAGFQVAEVSPAGRYATLVVARKS